MNGESLLLDTNAFIYFFEGRSTMTELVMRTPLIYYSVITEIELLSAPRLTAEQIEQIRGFLALCRRIDLDREVVERTIEVRRRFRFRTPDAIIAASALVFGMPVVSADTSFRRIAELTVIADIVD